MVFTLAAAVRRRKAAAPTACAIRPLSGAARPPAPALILLHAAFPAGGTSAAPVRHARSKASAICSVQRNPDATRSAAGATSSYDWLELGSDGSRRKKRDGMNRQIAQRRKRHRPGNIASQRDPRFAAALIWDWKLCLGCQTLASQRCPRRGGSVFSLSPREILHAGIRTYGCPPPPHGPANRSAHETP
jgi:hypothetical protein